MTIDFCCPKCQAPIRAPENMGGRCATCLKCGAELTVPSQSRVHAANVVKQSEPQVPSTIDFECPHCRATISAPSDSMGQPGNCTSCGAEHQVPTIGGVCSPSPASSAKPSWQPTGDGRVPPTPLIDPIAPLGMPSVTELHAQPAPTDGFGIIALVLGLIACISLLFGCFTLGWGFVVAVPFAGLGCICALFARGGMKVAGITLNIVALLPAIALATMLMLGIGAMAAFVGNNRPAGGGQFDAQPQQNQKRIEVEQAREPALVRNEQVVVHDDAERINRAKQSFDQHVRRGNAALEMRKFADAIDEFDQATRVHDDPTVQGLLKQTRDQRDHHFREAMNAGQNAVKLRKLDEAIASFAEACSLDPADQDAAAGLRDANRRKIAGEFQRFLKQGRAEFETGDYEKSVASLKEAIDILPNDAEANRLLEEARFRFHAGQSEYALVRADYGAALAQATVAAEVPGKRSAMKPLLDDLQTAVDFGEQRRFMPFRDDRRIVEKRDLIAALGFNKGRDGLALVTVKFNGQASIWDVNQLLAAGPTADKTARLEVPAPEGINVARICLAESGIAFAAANSKSDIIVRRIDKIDEPMPIKSAENGITTLALLSDGTKVAAGFGSGKVGIWDVLRPVALPIEIESVGRTAITCLRFSHDGTKLAVGTEIGGAVICDAKSGKHLARMNGIKVAHKGGTSVVEFSPDDQLLVTAGRDNTISSWSVVTGDSQLALPIALGNFASCLAIGADNSSVAAVAKGEPIRRFGKWAQELRKIPAHGLDTVSLVYGPGGLVATAGADGWIKLWEGFSMNRD